MDARQPTNPRHPLPTADSRSQRAFGPLGSIIPSAGYSAGHSAGGPDCGSDCGSSPKARIAPTVAVAAGVLLVVLVGSVGTARAAWRHITVLLSTSASASVASGAHRRAQNDFEAMDPGQLDRLDAQSQAETLLEDAVSDSGAAVEEISARLDRWQGKLKWDTQIANLATAALSSRDLRVRRSGVEVELAAYGLAKNTASLNYVLQAARSKDRAKRTWALWALGLLANRGIGTPLAVQTLSAGLQDSDEQIRRWAVASLAVAGSSQVIAPLLRTMHDDPSPGVRESAASGLAESGMLTREERLAAVPELLNYTEDSSLDGQTRNWAFQALACITGQRLPNDPAAWRHWYTSAKVD